MWIQVAAVIEAMALTGVVSVLVTKQTKIAFVAGFDTMALVIGVFAWHAGLNTRMALASAMAALYLLRMNWALFVWSRSTALSKLDTRLPELQKLFLPVVLTNTVGWAYCLPFYFAAVHQTPLSFLDAVAVLVYLVGTVFHFGGDYQKRRFKLRSENKGVLLNTGFWALCRHPNYFGDFLIYVSFALISHSIWGWIAPALNLAQYVFDAIPKNEKWAAEKYGASWAAYKQRTKAFIPYIA